MKTDGAILTNAGMELITYCMAFNKALRITKGKIGTGNIDSLNTAKSLKNLVSVFMETEINSVQCRSNDIRIRTSFTNENFTSDTTIKEIGIFAECDGKPEILLAYVNTDPGEVIPAGNSGESFESTKDIYVGISETTNVVNKIDRDLTHVTLKDLEEYIKSNEGLCAVGGIVMFDDNTNPATKWVGTKWRKIENRFLYGTTGNEEAGVIGGSQTVTLAIGNMPRFRLQVDAHAHSQPPHQHIESTSEREHAYQFGQAPGTNGKRSYETREGYAVRQNAYTSSAGGDITGSSSPYTSYIGEGKSFSVLPPFYKIHIWRRTA